MPRRPTKRRPVHFLARIAFSDDCWEWTGAIGGGGYGSLTRDKKRLPAHRYVYEQMVGPIPEGHHLHHVCENKACVRPDHLEPVLPIDHPGTAWDINRQKTHCPQGHEYTGANVRYMSGKRGRICRACHIDANRRYKARKRRLRDEGEATPILGEK